MENDFYVWIANSNNKRMMIINPVSDLNELDTNEKARYIKHMTKWLGATDVSNELCQWAQNSLVDLSDLTENDKLIIYMQYGCTVLPKNMMGVT